MRLTRPCHSTDDTGSWLPPRAERTHDGAQLRATLVTTMTAIGDDRHRLALPLRIQMNDRVFENSWVAPIVLRRDDHHAHGAGNRSAPIGGQMADMDPRRLIARRADAPHTSRSQVRVGAGKRQVAS